ncbi:hypothetical protein ES703_22912 [subsurface metagenome]
MNDTLVKDQDVPDVETIQSETVLHGEPELLIPADEYATRHGICRRTVNRYVKSGRLDSTKQRGRTMIVDKPLKPKSVDTLFVRPNIDSQIVPFAQADWIRFGFLQARSKSKTIWQTYAIALTVIFVSLMLLCLWLFTQWRFLTSTP